MLQHLMIAEPLRLEVGRRMVVNVHPQDTFLLENSADFACRAGKIIYMVESVRRDDSSERLRRERHILGKPTNEGHTISELGERKTCGLVLRNERIEPNYTAVLERDRELSRTAAKSR